METNHQQEYEARLKRYTHAASLTEPDRVPVIPDSLHYFPAKVSGMTFQQAMHDHQHYFDAIKQAVLKDDFDMATTTGVYPAQTWEALGLKKLEVAWEWPCRRPPLSIPGNRGDAGR